MFHLHTLIGLLWHSFGPRFVLSEGFARSLPAVRRHETPFLAELALANGEREPSLEHSRTDIRVNGRCASWRG
jgi:hypothetical protein